MFSLTVRFYGAFTSIGTCAEPESQRHLLFFSDSSHCALLHGPKKERKTKSSTNRPLLFTGGMEKAKLSFNKLLDNHVNKGGETLCVLHDSAFAFYLTQISRTHPVSRIPVHGMSGSFPADCFSLKKSVHIVLHYTRVVTR